MPAKILIVDDEADIRGLVSLWLKSAGYEVSAAQDGNDCLSKLKDGKFDVILLDVMMPGPKPKEILDGIKKSAPKSKVIYLSAVEWLKETESQVSQGYVPVIDLPVVGYILKPVTKENLLSKVTSVLAMPALAKEKKPATKKKK